MYVIGMESEEKTMTYEYIIGRASSYKYVIGMGKV